MKRISGYLATVAIISGGLAVLARSEHPVGDLSWYIFTVALGAPS